MTATTTSSTLIINMKWVYLCFFVSVLLISNLAISSASARKLLVSSETQQTTQNPDQYSFDLHEEPSGREEGSYESDNSDEVSTNKVPRSANYGNMDGILSVPAIPESAVPQSVDYGNIDKFPSVSQHESDNSDEVSTKVPRSANYGNMDGILSVPAIPESAVPQSVDYGNIDEFPSVSQHNNADAVPKNAEYVNMDGILSVPAIPESAVPQSVDYGNIDEFPSVSQHNNADAVPKNAEYVNMDEFAGVFVPKNADPVVPRNADYVDIDGNIDGINSSINIPRPLTGEPDPDEQFESKDLANAIKPVESSDSVNAMEAAAGVPIH